MANDSTAVERIRIQVGGVIIAAALVLLGAIFGVAIWRFETANEVTAVIGAMSGVVGTVTGAFFGVQVGASGKERAEERADRTQSQLTALLAETPPQLLEQVRTHPGLEHFPN